MLAEQNVEKETDENTRSCSGPNDTSRARTWKQVEPDNSTDCPTDKRTENNPVHATTISHGYFLLAFDFRGESGINFNYDLCHNLNPNSSNSVLPIARTILLSFEKTYENHQKMKPLTHFLVFVLVVLHLSSSQAEQTNTPSGPSAAVQNSSAGNPSNPTPSATETFSSKNYSKYLAIVEGDKMVGSGFCAIYQGKPFLFTNTHVLSGNTRIKARTLDGKPLLSKINGTWTRGVDFMRLGGPQWGILEDLPPVIF